MSSAKQTKTDENWEKLFKHHDILSKVQKDGFYNITSRQINKFRESRLMVKFDHRTNLPRLFRDNHLSILPLTRGSYTIGDFMAYQKLENKRDTKKIKVSLPDGLESIDPNNLYSEAAALNCAYLCGVIEDLMGEEAVLTVSGKMSTASFTFNIRTHSDVTKPLSVDRSQCEIDGGFESQNKFMLVEAKNFIADDFLIRQLYYPYRLWKKRLRKEIVPVFMTFSNDVFSFYVFEFKDTMLYNSLELIEQKNYIIAPEAIKLEDLQSLCSSVRIVSEEDVSFPQADSFERIVDLLGLLFDNDLSREEITSNYAFVQRQTNYYTSAGIYLGVIKKKRKNNVIVYSLNELGRRIMAKPHKQKFLGLAERILEHEVFNKAFIRSLKMATTLGQHDAVDIMKTCKIYNVRSDNTYERRAQTVISWIDWILGLQSA